MFRKIAIALLLLVLVLFFHSLALAGRKKACQHYSNTAALTCGESGSLLLNVSGFDVGFNYTQQLSTTIPLLGVFSYLPGMRSFTFVLNRLIDTVLQGDEPFGAYIYDTSTGGYRMDIPCVNVNGIYYFSEFDLDLKEEVRAVLKEVNLAPDLTNTRWLFDFDKDGDGIYDIWGVEYHFGNDYIIRSAGGVSNPPFDNIQATLYKDLFFLYDLSAEVDVSGKYNLSQAPGIGIISGSYATKYQNGRFKATPISVDVLSRFRVSAVHISGNTIRPLRFIMNGDKHGYIILENNDEEPLISYSADTGNFKYENCLSFFLEITRRDLIRMYGMSGELEITVTDTLTNHTESTTINLSDMSIFQMVGFPEFQME